ncbi:hypothetical protein BRADI_4g13592v3 [Brachypodium distachyon]|uniref:Uncharacterized protein n=1 Tax=Brachypodium distachyon TaxID=15368 RepID=A0A2K2CMK9_BRADI|nr:hypothetical protein BRADI_4g13592v3 [Brachypodium distachyon]
MKQMCDWVYGFPYRYRRLIAVGIVILCWTIRKTRNETCFQGNYPKDPAYIVFLLCHWLKYWAGLQKSSEKEKLLSGVYLIQTVNFITETSAVRFPQ